MATPDEYLTSIPRARDRPAQADVPFNDDVHKKPSTLKSNAPGFSHGLAIGDKIRPDTCSTSVNITTSLATSSLFACDQLERAPVFVSDDYIDQAKPLKDMGGNAVPSSDFHSRGSTHGGRTKACKLRKYTSAEGKMDILNSILQASSIDAAGRLISKHQSTWHNLDRYARKVLTKVQLARIRGIVDECKLNGLADTEAKMEYDRPHPGKLIELGAAQDVHMTIPPGPQSLASMQSPSRMMSHRTILEVTDHDVSFSDLLTLLGSGLGSALQTLRGRFQYLTLEGHFVHPDLPFVLVLPGTADTHPIWTITHACFGPDTIGQLVQLRGCLICVQMS